MFIFSHVSINEFTDLSDIFIVFFKHIIFHSLPVNTVDQLFRVIKELSWALFSFPSLCYFRSTAAFWVGTTTTTKHIFKIENMSMELFLMSLYLLTWYEWQAVFWKIITDIDLCVVVFFSTGLHFVVTCFACLLLCSGVSTAHCQAKFWYFEALMTSSCSSHCPSPLRKPVN